MGIPDCREFISEFQKPLRVLKAGLAQCEINRLQRVLSVFFTDHRQGV
jgi:hypothetical protein